MPALQLLSLQPWRRSTLDFPCSPVISRPSVKYTQTTTSSHPPTAPTLVPAIIFLARVIATALDVLPASALALLQSMLETAQGDPLKQKPERKPSLLRPPSATSLHPIWSSSHGPYSGLRGPCDPALLPQSYSISFHLACPTMPSCPIVSQTPQQPRLGIPQLLSLSPPALLSPGLPQACSAVSSSEACPGSCI